VCDGVAVAGNYAGERLEDRCMELEAMTVLGTRLATGDSRAVEDV
jgi:hypothetical protein